MEEDALSNGSGEIDPEETSDEPVKDSCASDENEIPVTVGVAEVSGANSEKPSEPATEGKIHFPRIEPVTGKWETLLWTLLSKGTSRVPTGSSLANSQKKSPFPWDIRPAGRCFLHIMDPARRGKNFSDLKRIADRNLKFGTTEEEMLLLPRLFRHDVLPRCLLIDWLGTPLLQMRCGRSFLP
jgi:hypothetical protein